MQQSPLFLSPADLNKMYRELLQHPDFVHQLTDYYKSKLREYAEEAEHSAMKLADGIILKNPAYNYPAPYRGNEFEYWMNTISSGWESRQVLQLLAEKPALTVSTPYAPIRRDNAQSNKMRA